MCVCVGACVRAYVCVCVHVQFGQATDLLECWSILYHIIRVPFSKEVPCNCLLSKRVFF